MTNLNDIVGRAERLVFGECPDWRGVAFFRVSLAATLIALTLLTWAQYVQIYGSTGYVQRDISEVLISDGLVTTYKLTDLLRRCFGLDEVSSLLLLRWVYLGSLASLCAGFLTRPSAAVCWLLHLAFVKSAHNFMYGADYIHTIMLFFCVVLPVGRRYSADAWLFGAKSGSALPSLRVFQIQLCIIYFFAGLAKALGPGWWNGESIWKSLHRPVLGDFDFSWLALYPYVAAAMGVGVVLIELLYPLMVWVRRFGVNRLWLWSVVSMHLGIALFLDLHIFSATMIAFNLSAFYFFDQKRAAPRALTPAPSAY